MEIGEFCQHVVYCLPEMAWEICKRRCRAPWRKRKGVNIGSEPRGVEKGEASAICSLRIAEDEGSIQCTLGDRTERFVRIDERNQIERAGVGYNESCNDRVLE